VVYSVKVLDRRGAPGVPKSDEHRAAIGAAVRRKAEYRKLLLDFYRATTDDTYFHDNEQRRLQQVRLARLLLIRAPKKEKVRWRHWLAALRPGDRLIKTSPVAYPSEEA
jgi:hypothetical protein